jgi:hypothetical protein
MSYAALKGLKLVRQTETLKPVLVSGINCNTFRGRRLALFRLCDEIEVIINALDVEEDASPIDPGPTMKIDAAHKRELVNQLAVLKRTILLWNDGRVTPEALKPY